MRKLQRVAVVAAAIAGLSAIGAAGTAYAHEGDWDAPDVTAVATSQANAVATWGAPHGGPHSDKKGAPYTAPEAGPKNATPEIAYGEYAAPYVAK